MRAVVQRVKHASVTVNGKLKGAINKGYLVLLGIEHDDTKEDIGWLCKKLVGLRVFNDSDGKMNLNIEQVDGSFLIISQFTLFASTKKGNRPSFIRSAKPTIAIPLYQTFITTLRSFTNQQVEVGEFGADMKVNLLNDGPVTIIIDSKRKE